MQWISFSCVSVSIYLYIQTPKVSLPGAAYVGVFNAHIEGLSGWSKYVFYDSYDLK